MGHLMKNVLFAHLETIFSLIFGGILAILPIFTPDFTSVTENSTLRRTVELSSVSTSVKTEKIAVETQNTTQTATVNVASAASGTSTSVLTTKKTSSLNYVTVGNNRIDIFFTDNIVQDKNPGSEAGLYGKLLYAHNTSDKFGPIMNFVEGKTTFKITLNGVTKEYRAVKKVTMLKEDADRFMGANGNKNTGFPAGKYRSGVYDYVLMTCDGTNLGDGKATHRTLIFATETK